MTYRKKLVRHAGQRQSDGPGPRVAGEGGRRRGPDRGAAAREAQARRVRGGACGAAVGRHYLAQLADAELEIQARLPEGASQEVRRVVEENCRTLRFSSFGYEEE